MSHAKNNKKKNDGDESRKKSDKKDKKDKKEEEEEVKDEAAQSGTLRKRQRKRVKGKKDDDVRIERTKVEREERVKDENDDNDDDDDGGDAPCDNLNNIEGHKIVVDESDEDSEPIVRKPSTLADIDFARLIAQSIVFGRRNRRAPNAIGGGDEDDSDEADDGMESSTESEDMIEDIKDRAEAVLQSDRMERRKSKRQKMKDLRFSFAPQLAQRRRVAADASTDAEYASEESTESSSEVHAEIRHYHEFLARTQAAISKARNSDDERQILVFGRDKSFKSISIESAVKLGYALCRRTRERERETAAQTGNDIVWIDFTNHTVDDVEQIRHAFGLHPISIEDCVHQRQGMTASDKATAKVNDRVAPLREKVEFFRRYSVVVTGELDDEPIPGATLDADDVPVSTNGKRVGDYSVARITIVTFERVVLTFRQRRCPSFLPVVFRLIRGQHRGVVPHANWPLMTFLDEAMSHLQVLVAEMIDVIDDLNEKVLTERRGSQDLLLRRLSFARRGLLALRVMALAKRDLIEQMMRHDTFKSGEDPFKEMLEDIESMYGRLSMGFEVLNHLDDTFLNRINLEVALEGEAMNVVMKKFSTVATIFLPLTTIGSIWGMNMKVPGQAEDDSDLSVFFIVVGVMAGLALMIILYLWRKGWF